MAKVLRIAALVVAVAAAIPTGGTSLLGAGLGVSTATASMIAMGVAVASSVVTALTMKPPAIQGGQTEWRSDPNAPSRIVMGRTAVGGDVIYRKTGNRPGKTKNAFQFVGSVLSGCGPIDAIEATWVDGVPTEFDETGVATAEKLTNRVWQASQLGLCPEPAALTIAGEWDGTGGIPSWSPMHKLSGCAAVMNVYKFDGKGDNTFTQVPRMQWLLRGVKCYDPRRDSTYPGGSGPQRAGDQTTWAYSENPWILAVTYALGWRQGPNNIRVGGVGMPVTSIDLPAYVEAANIADANGWKLGGSISNGDDKWQNLKAICQAGGGEPVRLGGLLSCMVNTPRLSLATITRDDVINEASITTTQTRRDRINGIIPKYRSEDHKFEVVPAGVVRNAAFLAEDGGIERTKEIDYSLVQCVADDTPDQVAQLAGYDIANAREAGPVVLPLKLRWLGFRAGDCLSIENVPEFGHLAGKDVVVLRRQLDPQTMSVVLTLREETPAKHTWALGLVGTPAPTTDTNEEGSPNAPDPADWTVTTSVMWMRALGLGSILLQGSVSDPTANVVIIELREHGATAWDQYGVLSATATKFRLEALDMDKAYDVAVSYFAGARLIFSNLTFDASGHEIVYDGGSAGT